MIIHLPEVRNANGHARLIATVEADGVNQPLWYEVEARLQHYLTYDRLDCFVVALLILAMRRGENIFLRGPMSERLYYNLTNYYIPIVKVMIPSLQRVEIIPPI